MFFVNSQIGTLKRDGHTQLYYILFKLFLLNRLPTDCFTSFLLYKLFVVLWLLTQKWKEVYLTFFNFYSKFNKIFPKPRLKIISKFARYFKVRQLYQNFVRHFKVRQSFQTFVTYFRIWQSFQTEGVHLFFFNNDIFFLEFPGYWFISVTFSCTGLRLREMSAIK